MPSAAIMQGTGATSSAAHPYSLEVSGRDLITQVDRRSIRVYRTLEGSSVSTMSFRVENTDNTLDFSGMWGRALSGHGSGYGAAWSMQPVLFHDHTTNRTLFRGFVDGLRMGSAYAGGTFIEVRAVGISTMMDRLIIVQDVTIDRTKYAGPLAMVSALLALVPTQGVLFIKPIGAEWDGVYMVGSQTISAGTTLRTALLSLLEELGGTPSVLYADDVDGGVYVYTTGDDRGSAPKNIDYAPSGGGEVAAEELVYDLELGDFRNTIYIDSATAAGKGWVQRLMIESGDPTISQFVTQTYLRDDASTTAATRDVLGDRSLRGTHTALEGALTVRVTGAYNWGLDQVTVLDYFEFVPFHSAEHRITGIGLTFDAGGDPVYDLSLAIEGAVSVTSRITPVPVGTRAATVMSKKYRPAT